MLKGNNKRPDILIVESNVSPVCIETEIMPASTVEKEAKSRLGEKLRRSGKSILSSIAVRLPQGLTSLHAEELRNQISEANDYEYALYTGVSPSECFRWPQQGWIEGDVRDLSILAQSATVPPKIIEEAVEALVAGLREASGLLGEIALDNPSAVSKISAHLRQEDGEQTRRMAATILVDAFLFHENLAGGPGRLKDVVSIEELRSDTGVLYKSAILREWRKILKVNYWPIFDIARRLLETVPTANSDNFLDTLSGTAEKLLQNRLMRSHDLTGAVFQRLISDRKFLAAYYTSPASASLLTSLAFNSTVPLAGVNWGDKETLTKLRIADFACGTRTLLSSAYQRIGQLHELDGGDVEALHPQLMANTFVGCDVLPSAAHLTASMLSGIIPQLSTKKVQF